MSFILGAYWDARPDDLRQCTENAGRLFAGLAEIDPLLAHWYERGRSSKDALKRKVDISDARRLEGLLLKGRSQRDIGREIVETLGFRMGVWNGADKDEAEACVDIHCGCYSERIGNTVIIELPRKSEGLRWVENASALLALVAEIWRPNWAGIMSKKAIEERDFDADLPFVDWMVYVPRPVHAVPSPSRVEDLKSLGSIIVVQPSPPVGNDPEELSRIRRVESILATDVAPGD